MLKQFSAATTISYKRTKIVAIWQQHKRVLDIFTPRMRRNGYLGTSSQKSDPAIRFGDLDFLWDRCISITEWRLLDIFNVFGLLRRMTFWPWPWPFDHVQWFACPSHILVFIILRISVTELRVLNIWSHFRYLKQSMRMRRVTWPLTGDKYFPQSLTPICLFTLSLSGLYDED